MTSAYENLSNRAQSAALQCWLSWGAVHAPEKLPAGALSKLLLVALCPGFWAITAVLWCHAKCYLSSFALRCLLKDKNSHLCPVCAA